MNEVIVNSCTEKIIKNQPLVFCVWLCLSKSFSNWLLKGLSHEMVLSFDDMYDKF
jgi:hypothetical protein